MDDVTAWDYYFIDYYLTSGRVLLAWKRTKNCCLSCKMQFCSVKLFLCTPLWHFKNLFVFSISILSFLFALLGWTRAEGAWRTIRVTRSEGKTWQRIRTHPTPWQDTAPGSDTESEGEMTREAEEFGQRGFYSYSGIKNEHYTTAGTQNDTECGSQLNTVKLSSTNL